MDKKTCRSVDVTKTSLRRIAALGLWTAFDIDLEFARQLRREILAASKFESKA